MSVSIVILAAGEGSRMRSSLPKVLHPIGGVPMLRRVIETSQKLEPKQIVVVCGHQSEQLQGAMDGVDGLRWVHQDKQLGTAHALSCALPLCDDEDSVLVLYADVALVSHTTLVTFLNLSSLGLGVLTARVPDPSGLGRIVRSEDHAVQAIVEHKDASEPVLQINEINSGIMCARASQFKSWIPRIGRNNQQKEYYLTDVVALSVEENTPVVGHCVESFQEVLGVNSLWQLQQQERFFQERQAKQLCDAGVHVVDAHRFRLEACDFHIEKDVVIEPDVCLKGSVKIASGCRIGQGSILENVTLGHQVGVEPYSILEGVEVAANAKIGPFARLRPGTVLEKHTKVGNFVELKKTHLGAYSKVSHLSYLGDSHVGERVNIGAGTITCNYDGVNKYQTQIDSGAFIGANSSLVAPVHIGSQATIGAGSVIAKDAPAKQLTLGRAKQKSIASWVSPRGEQTTACD